MASSNLATYLGSGLAADLPDAATLAANLFDGMTAFYFATDTNELYMLDPSGTPSWTVQSAPGGLYQPLSAVLTAYASGDTPSAFTLGIVDSADAAAWRTAIGAGTSSTTGTVTSVDGSSSASGFSLTGGPITSSGTLTFGVSDQALARTSLGLGTMATQSASSYQPSSTVLTAYAGGDTPSAFTLGIVDSVDAAAWRAAIGAGTSTVTPSALTKADDTNVTLTLGGTPSTALLAPASLTLGWTGTLSQSRGGFGQNVAAVNGYAKATTGTFAFSTTIPGSDVSGNISGNAANVTGTVAIANGGTGATSASAARTALGLGTAAVQNTGTSGANVPLLNGGNTWSAGQIIQSSTSFDDMTGTSGVFTRYRTSGSNRWSQGKNGVTESGGNAGSDYVLDRHDDSGAYIANALYIERSTGRTTVGGLFRPSADNTMSLGEASRRWSVVYAGTGTINTSDERQKRDIQPIRDDLLDAWAGVNWVAYRFNEAYERKGDDARWHFGAIAQQVRDVIDARLGEGAALRLGLVCYDEWDEQPEETVPVLATRGKPSQRPVLKERFIPNGDGSFSREVYDTGEVEDYTEQEEYDTGEVEIVRPYRAAGNRWGLRYTECFALEAAYQRRRMDRIEAALTSLGR